MGGHATGREHEQQAPAVTSGSGSNWAHRYGPNHRRICARPGCGAPAAATLRFQPTQREAWLVELEADAVRTEGDLCARHAAGLVLPRGWQLHSELESAPNSATKPAPPARRSRGASIARARRRRTATTAVELPGLSAVSDPEPEAAPEPVVVPEAVVVAPEPAPAPEAPAPLVADATPEESAALAETLDAQTPLLRRAFGNVWLPDGNPPSDAS